MAAYFGGDACEAINRVVNRHERMVSVTITWRDNSKLPRPYMERFAGLYREFYTTLKRNEAFPGIVIRIGREVDAALQPVKRRDEDRKIQSMP